ncbi:MAG: methyl-accepting chemotaxis protein [Myxococcales bacterium]|nr:methyl-accepting chemotaxis protein [Myxococcales bacterium]
MTPSHPAPRSERARPQRSSPRASSRPPGARRRRLRNFLIEPGLQLKYVAMLVCAALLVAAPLGALAYSYSTGQSEALALQVASDPSVTPETATALRELAAAQDRDVLRAIVCGTLAFVLVVGCAGVVVTHRIVGPAYRIRTLLEALARGELPPTGQLRRGDELQALHDVLAVAIERLRDDRAAQIDALDAATRAARAAGCPQAVSDALDAARARLGDAPDRADRAGYTSS